MNPLQNDLKTKRFWRHLLINAFACMGALAAAIQALIVFFPDLAKYNGALAFILFGLIGFFFGLFRAWPRPIEEDFSAPKMSIIIEEGNLFDKTGNIVLGFCNTFDTKIPNIIARNSIQGQALDLLFNGDIQELDDQIEKVLRTKQVIGHINKEGKQAQYEIGTVLPIKQNSRWLYLLAYSEMNDHNEARATVDDVWKSLNALWQEISRSANGSTVCIPVIGGGQARLSSILPAQDSIRLILLSFMFASRKEKICEELRIVVHPNDFERLDRMELQSFLSSLRPS